jgi:hypothetical protein
MVGVGLGNLSSDDDNCLIEGRVLRGDDEASAWGLSRWVANLEPMFCPCSILRSTRRGGMGRSWL